MAEQHPRAWQRMLSGRRLDLLNPSPLDVEIEDIAHGLSRVARWNGQTHGDWAFSVAQHCLLVEELCGIMKPDLPARWRLAALLHDAQEYVVGDLISPFKAAVGWSYKSLEKRLSSAVFLRFGLPGDLPKTVENRIKRGDQAAAYVEAVQLAGFEEKEARHLFRPPRGQDLSPERLPLTPLDPESAKAAYLARFEALQEAMKGAR
ncbi:HD domain-containing protein [Fodinicurvata halophila]|uniref:HD domain-containing protein n=1 Tax=Fodinicurvata halophila TaxID=1419723 RepID=A0ABV8UPR2_9PROT